MTIRPTNIDEVKQAVTEHDHVLPVGHGTKPRLSRVSTDTTRLDMTGLRGITEYEPNEFVFTALAGMSLAEVGQTLNKHGQYLPFDPPLASAGATLGGTVAAGLSGSGRLRYGGLRDFLIGVRFVDGLGQLITAGGRVVKNAAGFDMSKLMVGSMGRLGVLTELTFKVFPQPRHRLTMAMECRDLDDSITTLGQLAAGAWDLEALDLEPPTTLWIRMAGHAEPLKSRASTLSRAIDRPVEIWDGPADTKYWDQVSEFGWSSDNAVLVKVPLTTAKIAPLEEAIRSDARRRYSVAGNVAWLSWPADSPIADLDAPLVGLELQGLVIKGDVERMRIGVERSQYFLDRVKSALDPQGRFPE